MLFASTFHHRDITLIVLFRLHFITTPQNVRNIEFENHALRRDGFNFRKQRISNFVRSSLSQSKAKIIIDSGVNSRHRSLP
ncbi:hypothetical protein SAMN04490189_2567 [Pseudomonas koreensis]|nr:hypothetical protein SAMN04490189_2567 [Pseudomonas koreensis]